MALHRGRRASYTVTPFELRPRQSLDLIASSHLTKVILRRYANELPLDAFQTNWDATQD
jgi:hypothetical protein